MTKKTLKYIVGLLILLCAPLTKTYAQQDTIYLDDNPTNNATLFGVGSANIYDTYLSILKYEGVSFRVMNERMRRTNWFNGNFDKQQIISLEFASVESPSGNAEELFFLLDYNLGGHMRIYRNNNFRFSAGGLWNIAGGVLYNQRNTNNPASARLYSNINLSALAIYNWKRFTFRWQMNTLIAGVLFSPEFGQSYYELSLGNSVGIFNFASLHNQRALRNYISVDIPLNKYTFRVGYLGSYYQTKINHIQTHNYSNSFIIGIASESINLSGSNIKRSKVKSSFY